jgi:hypothetical protein
MNLKRWLAASVAVFFVYVVVEMIVHGVLLEEMYQQTASVWRPEADMERLMWLLWLGYLIVAPFFAFIYIKGYEKNKGGLGQGLRYGLYMGVLLSTLRSLGSYFSLPMPGLLAFYWFLDGMAVAVISGLAVGLIYREE